jgi:16S rRNA (adenine1518-N6/adenine1519-N6)-dimethyltransferase
MDRNKRRRFGQNFLSEPDMAYAIAGDLPCTTEDRVLEIGPGHGAITKSLLHRCQMLTAVEIDSECVKYLRFKIQDRRFELINENFLNFDIESYLQNNPDPWVIGNLPYNVATPIMTRLFPYLNRVKGMMFMVQYEVAKRLCADPGSSDYGWLSVLLQSYGKAKILRKVEGKYFRPRPNVLSATLLFESRPDTIDLTPELSFFITLCFSQKRKKLMNAVQKEYSRPLVKAALETMGLTENVRAEELSPIQFKDLYSKLKAH